MSISTKVQKAALKRYAKGCQRENKWPELWGASMQSFNPDGSKGNIVYTQEMPTMKDSYSALSVSCMPDEWDWSRDDFGSFPKLYPAVSVLDDHEKNFLVFTIHYQDVKNLVAKVKKDVPIRTHQYKWPEWGMVKLGERYYHPYRIKTFMECWKAETITIYQSVNDKKPVYIKSANGHALLAYARPCYLPGWYGVIGMATGWQSYL